MPDGKNHADKYKQAARELETNDDPERKERLRNLVKHKPVINLAPESLRCLRAAKEVATFTRSYN